MKKYFALFLSLSTVLFAAGCIKETRPQGSTLTAEQAFASPTALEAMVNAIPSTMTTTNMLGFDDDHFDFGLPSFHIVTESMLQDYVTLGATPGYNRYYQWKANRFQGADDTFYSGFLWIGYYKYIKGANDIIGAIDPATASADVVGYLGQAYAWRAFYYLDLARLYEPKENKYTEIPASILGLTVPIVTEKTTETDAFNNPRAKREDLYKFILDDLSNAEKYISATDRNYTRPTLAAVYATYAKAYLEMGYWEDKAEYFNKAAEYAAKGITQSGKTPLTQAEWEDPANGFNNGAANNSWIWGLKVSAENLGNLQTFTSMMSNEATWGYAPYYLPGALNKFYEAIPATDFRKHSWIDPAYAADPASKQPYDYKFAGTDADKANFLALLADGSMPPYASLKFRPMGGECSNYKPGNAADHPILRVEELWFIEIEALAKAGKIGEAQSLLNEFMSYRITTGTPYDCSAKTDLNVFLEELLFQKRVEFWGEGVLFFDFKRMGHGIERGFPGSNECGVFQMNTEGVSPQWNLVIPVLELNSNTGITNATNNPNPSGEIDLYEED